MRKILITNIVTLNPGDSAILWGTLEILRRRYGPGTEIVVFDKNAEAAGRYYPWAKFRQSLFAGRKTSWAARVLERWGYAHWYHRLRYVRLRVALWLYIHHAEVLAKLVGRAEFSDIAAYAEADLIISTGGTYLIEKYGLRPPIADYRISLATGRPLLFFTQTLGPFKSPATRASFVEIFSRAQRVLVRDQRSCSNLLEIGVPREKIFVGSDAAFVIDERGRAAWAEGGDGRPALAVSVRTLQIFNDQEGAQEQFEQGVARLVAFAVRRYGARVVFLSTCQGLPEYWTDDAEVALRIRERLPGDVKDDVEVDRRFRQPVEVARIYGTFDAVIAMRMHAAILALTSGVPAIGIAYEFKTEELFAQLGMERLLLNASDLAGERPEQALDALFCDLPGWRSHIESRVEVMRQRAWSVVEALPDLDEPVRRAKC